MGRESPMEIWRRRRLAIVVLLVAVVPSYGVSSHATVEAPNALVELEEGASELDAAADNDEQLEKLGAEDLEMGEDESLGTEKKSSRKKSKKKSSWRRKKSKKKSSWRRKKSRKAPGRRVKRKAPGVGRRVKRKAPGVGRRVKKL